MPARRKWVGGGHKIPDKYMEKDADGTTSGQQIFTKAGTTTIVLSGSDADLVLSGTMAQIVFSGTAGTLNMSGPTPAIVGAIQHRNTKAGTVAIELSGSDADLQLTGTNSQIIMSGDASGIRLTGTGARFYLANDLGQVGTIDFTGSSVRLYFGGGTGTFV